ASAPARLEEALRKTGQSLDRLEGRATVAGFEWKLPEDALADAATAVTSVTRVESAFRESAFSDVPRYLEIIRTPDFSAQVPLYFLALAAQSSPHVTRAKIRCGGMDESDFPITTELARFMQAAVRTGHPFKATAGLHHPIRHFNEGQQVWMHGFLNVFFATTLGRKHDLDINAMRTILEETDPGHFHFSDSGIRWKDLSATTTDFIQDRRSLCLTIGSCSFDEPRQDLHNLGWLSH
ncbi:MAG: hypothetical protein OXT73_04875, partial [Bacteroidota bacterium]|nr:hypothetical protein [Bacteroidota bacterium]